MNNYFKNLYDPSLEEMKKMFPEFEYGTKESWLKSYKSVNLILDEYIEFTLNKMCNVKTSYKLSDKQKVKLKMLELNNLNEEERWKVYCNILTPKQMCYMGI